MKSRVSGSSGAHNLLENEAGTRGWRDNERVFVVVQDEEASTGKEKRGGKEAANVSTHTNSGWRAPSWLHNMKCQQWKVSLLARIGS